MVKGLSGQSGRSLETLENLNVCVFASKYIEEKGQYTGKSRKREILQLAHPFQSSSIFFRNVDKYK